MHSSKTKFHPSRNFVVTLLLILGATSVVRGASRFIAPDPSESPSPKWIWGGTATHDGDVYYFRKTFDVAANQGVKSAALWIDCDDEFVATINNTEAVAGKNKKHAEVVDVSGLIQSGTNALVVKGTNETGVAGLIAKLVITLNDGSRQQFVTDASWSVSAHTIKQDPTKVAASGAPHWQRFYLDASEWTTPRIIAAYGDAPWGRVVVHVATSNQATPADRLTTMPGFKIERLYSVPRTTQGSWVCMTNDPKGRLIVSDQGHAGLYRVTPGKDEASTKVEKLDVEISSAQGLLWAFDSLYVSVNGTGVGGHESGVYRLHYNPDKDQFDDIKTLFTLAGGGGEHGPHALRLGPDNKIYLLCGDQTKVPKDLDPSSPHQYYSEDQLIPRDPDGNGFMTGVLAPGGFVCQFDPDGSHRKLICAGYRNPYDFAFNPQGELFAWDADMEWDIGMPWYRPTRLCTAYSGQEFGWRYGAGKWPDYYPDSMPPVVKTGLGSPTGIEFGTYAKFPAKYQHALYGCDWAYGKLDIFYITPLGAGYTATFEPFVKGTPFNCTDVVVNTDGAMYVTIGGRGSQSGLYRITYIGNESTAPSPEAEDSSTIEARQMRHKLEAFHGHRDPAAVDFAWPYLSSDDHYLNTAARVAIEFQDLAQWRERALQESRPTAAITAAIALAHVADASVKHDALENLNRLAVRKLSNEQLIDLLRADGLLMIRLGAPNDTERQELISRFGPLFPSPDEMVNRELCRMLVYLDAPDVVSKSLGQLAAATSQEDKVFYLYALRFHKTGWTLDQRKTYFAALDEAASYTGGASVANFIRHFREEAIGTLTADEKTALKDVLTHKLAPGGALVVKPRKFVKNWQAEDLLPQIDEVSTGRHYANGREVFETIGCTQCHRFANKGGSIGPDLTGVAGRFSAADIVAKLCNPSRAIADQYANTTIVTKDHDVIVGRLQSEDDKSVTLLTNFFTMESTTVPKANIVRRAISKVSPMPQGLIDNLSEDDIFDLVAYLRSGGDAHDKAFASQ